MKRIKNTILITTISIILLLILIFSLNSQIIKNINLEISSTMEQLQIPSIVNLSKIAGKLLDPEIILPLSLIVAILIWFIYSKKEAIYLASSMIVTGILILGLKNLIRVQRPENSILENSFLSFPSGHTTIILVILGIITYALIKKYKTEKIKIISITSTTLLTLIIGFSRIYINAHWFSDVLGGILLGSIILGLYINVKNK